VFRQFPVYMTGNLRRTHLQFALGLLAVILGLNTDFDSGLFRG